MTQQTIAQPRAGTSGASFETDTRTTRMLLAGGVAAAPLFILTASIQVLTRDGFDLSRHPISMLSVGDLGWVQIANFVVSGLLSVGFAVGMRRVLHPGRAGTWGPLLVGIFGVGLIAGGVFVPDPALGYPPGAPAGIPDQISWHAAAHDVAPIVAFNAMILACFVLVRRFAGQREWGWTAYTAATGVAALTLAAWPGLDGISVRLAAMAAIMFVWEALLAARLLAQLRTPAGTARRGS